MSHLRVIPTKPLTNFTFIKEVDFEKLATRMAEESKPGAQTIVRPAGLEKDIERIRLSLMSANANSVWLLGEEGVGKSLVISGLLQKIAKKEIGTSRGSLLSKRVFLFDTNNFFMVSMEKQISQFNDAMDFLNSTDCLLVIDRVDDFLLADGRDNGFFANSLVNCLTEGKTQAIITSQLKSRDALSKVSTAFVPCFVEQIVKEPDHENLLAVLRANRGRLEYVHSVLIPEEAVQETARVLMRYPGRAFDAAWPQGPLDLLDKTCAYVRMHRYGLPPDIMDKSERLLQLTDELSSLSASPHENKKRTEEINAEITQLNSLIDPAKKEWMDRYKPYLDTLTEISKTEAVISEFSSNKNMSPAERMELNMHRDLLDKLRDDSAKKYAAMNSDHPCVTRADVQTVFAEASGMSLADLSGDERARLLNTEASLGKTVFGQPVAVTETADILRAARTGMAAADRPAGVVMYVGPTGTGKTEITKALAGVDGGDGALPIIFPMNKFKDQSSASQFIGADPGLVGYSDDGPKMLQMVRKRPRCIVVFDEIEKADDSLFDTIMTITDEGYIIDSASNTVSFKDTICCFTTNVVLPEEFAAYVAQHEIDTNDKDAMSQALRQCVIDKINPKTGRPFFRPEFIGRIDSIIMFDYLSREAGENILRKEVTKQNKGLEGRNYRLEISPEVVSAMISKYFPPHSNGRTVRQFFNRLIRSQISKFVLTDTTPPTEDEIGIVNVEFDGEHVTLVRQSEARQEPVMRVV